MQFIEFEVFGKVQGVYFRKNTKNLALKLNLTGWCKNTDHGTVIGEAEGKNKQIDKMIHWLGNIGSPNSEIEKLLIKKRENITELKYKEFQIIRI